VGTGTLKVRYSHIFCGWVGTEVLKPQGLRNEMIVSSFIYVSFRWPCGLEVLIVSQYYDSENISESKLSFRRATSEPDHEDTYGRPDSLPMEALYDMDKCVALR